MRIKTYSFPKSSFLAIDKDMEILINLFLKNERLKKLLYYDVPDALKQPDVPQEAALKMFGQQIKIIPKLRVDYPEFCYVVITFDHFNQNDSNPQFRNSKIYFDIVCHYDQFQLDDLSLRHQRIAAEIDSMLNQNRLTGIGTVQFSHMEQIVLSDEFGGLSLSYEIIHNYNGEDSKYSLNPQEQLNINQNWDQIFNNSNEL